MKLVTLAFLLCLSLLFRCGGSGSVTVQTPKAPCKTTDIKLTGPSGPDPTFKVGTTSGQTFFTFDFCINCPGAGEGATVAPVAGLPVTVSLPGINLPAQTAKSDSNGCVHIEIIKASIDVGDEDHDSGKTVIIKLEGSDGTKDLPGPYTLAR